MKKIGVFAFLSLLLAGLTTLNAGAQVSPKPMATLPASNPWTNSQLLEPSVLAGEIKVGNAPVIFNIGVVEDIKGAKHIGPVSKAENLEKFRAAIAALLKNTMVVIYCGCCPFIKCPNIRPAFLELKKSGFSNIRVLNLPTNLNTNWTSVGYPLTAK